MTRSTYNTHLLPNVALIVIYHAMVPRGGRRNTQSMEPPFCAFHLFLVPRSHSLVPIFNGPIFEREPVCPFYAPGSTLPTKRKKRMSRVQRDPLKRFVVQQEEQPSQVNNHLKGSFSSSLILLIVNKE
ncbi:hypothetical protein E2542_SST16317 [Spatholobus suberectus]|nr:hypothetical protein E2542_SST16317 [Spatholobus suberectus]